MAENPIGNGSFKMKGAWQHNQSITVERDADFQGTAAMADEVVFKTTTPSTPHMLISSPVSSICGSSRSRPRRLPDPRIRQALSMAIDRQAIIDAVLNGILEPATGWVSPVASGTRTSVCTACAYDPDRARDLLAEAGGWRWGKIELWFNAGSGHEAWMQAIGDQLSRTSASTTS